MHASFDPNKKAVIVTIDAFDNSLGKPCAMLVLRGDNFGLSIGTLGADAAQAVWVCGRNIRIVAAMLFLAIRAMQTETSLDAVIAYINDAPFDVDALNDPARKDKAIEDMSLFQENIEAEIRIPELYKLALAISLMQSTIDEDTAEPEYFKTSLPGGGTSRNTHSDFHNFHHDTNKD